MGDCTRCGDSTLSVDEKGRCGACQVELEQRRVNYANRPAEKVAARKRKRREHYVANADEVKALSRAYYAANRERMIAKCRANVENDEPVKRRSVTALTRNVAKPAAFARGVENLPIALMKNSVVLPALTSCDCAVNVGKHKTK